MEKIRCTRCEEILKPDNVIWLELSNTDGKYYTGVPDNHVSQGGFAFGYTCSRKQLKEDHA